MTVFQMFLVIAIATGTGWMISIITLHFLFSSNSKKINDTNTINQRGSTLMAVFAARAGNMLQAEFDESGVLNQRLSDPVLLQKLKPEIEHHVDIFLNEKLALIFPLLYKFMGEKTLSQFKAAFLTETDLLFPVIIKKYMENLTAGIKINELVADKINAIPVSLIKKVIRENATKEVIYFKLICIATGAFSGVVTATVLHFIK